MIDLQKDGYFLNLDKPVGISSAKAVAIVKRHLGAKKVGHCGTLDPFANGVLMLAANKATKLAQEVMELTKQYRFTIQFGESRDSEDAEGKIIGTSDRSPEIAALVSVMADFIGEISQVPPNFSAISIDGKRCYDMARAGEQFSIPPRNVSIYAFSLINFGKKAVDSEGDKASKKSVFFAEFLVESSKGTYVRAISRDICKKLNLCGFVSDLKRTAIGQNCEKSAISLNQLILMARFFPKLLAKEIAGHQRG